MPIQKKPIILVDGSSYLYRAYHALPPLTNSKGNPTGAVYGMINMLRRLIADYAPEQMAIIFDTKGKTFRDELYPEYKATREDMPTELAQQIQPIHDIIRAMGIPLMMVEGVEADDVIGTLATQAIKHKTDVLISTGDKDFAQLVNSHTTLINTMSNTMLDPEGVKLKFGVPPERIIDYLTLVGDTSDNVPGVPQVGPKTAAKWLNEYGSLDNIIANVDNISGKVGNNLRNSLSFIPLTKQLVTIKLDVTLPFDLHDIAFKTADKEALINLFRELEFKSWLNDLLKESSQCKTTLDEDTPYETVTTASRFDFWINELEKSSLFAFDIETTDLNYMHAKLIGISFAIHLKKAVYIPIANVAINDVLKKIKPLLENPTIKKINHNIKYSMEVFANDDIHLQGATYDTLLEAYVLDSTANRLEKTNSHAAAHADATLQLHHTLWPRIEKESTLVHVFEKIEMPLVPVLVHMERCGVLIDPNKLKIQEQELQKRLLELENDVYKMAGCEFNLNSPKQLQEILFEKLKLPVLQKTPTGQPSTADSVLQELALDFAIPNMLIEYRSLSKLMSTYTSRLVEQINPDTGRIHTSYNQTVTATGRLSSSEPNLQNIPIRMPEGRRVRQAFIAAPGCQLISADYSQIELRLMAHISEDPALLSAFAQNLDIHKATAAEVWGVALEDVTQEMRRDAKAINFGLIYGMSAFGLTRQLGIDRKAAQNYIDRYFLRYPNVKKYMENTRLQAKDKGYVETLWGRRLYLPEINSKLIPRQKAAERTAINAPLQGSAADIIKMAMIKIDKWLQNETLQAKMIMQVHDELVFEVADASVDSVKKGIIEHMSQIVTLKVPLLVSVGIGDNWDSAHA